jgi:hypothetical protein
MFENIDKRKVVEMSSFSFETSASGNASATALVYQAFEKAIEEEAEVLFVSCLPAHLHLYQDLGLRPYGAKALNKENVGLQIPLVGILDINYYEEIHSPIFHIFKHHEEQAIDVSEHTDALLELVYEAGGSAETNPDVIRNEITLFFKDSILEQESTFNFLTFLPEKLINRIAESSTLLNFDTNEQVIQEDVRDQEFYFIMSGRLDIRKGRREEDTIASKFKGDIVGEVGFFRESGIRSASVYTAEPTRILVIRKSFLTWLRKKHPAEACIIYDALARVMAENIANS